MATKPIEFKEFSDLLDGLLKPATLAEVGALIVCLALSWVIVRLLRGREVQRGSIWFGERLVDGVLFPVVALALAFTARLLLTGQLKVAVFKLAIPILVSLLVIRLVVRVLRASFPSSGWVRRAERSISWIAWIGLVMWLTGVLPLVLEEMDEISWKVGATRLTLRNVVEGSLTAALVLMIALWISAAIEKQLLRGTGDDLSLRKIVANLTRAALLFIGLLFALSAVGIDLTALSVLGGAVGVGLGFGLQKIAANYVSGFVILAERSLRIGDMVRVDNFDGRISDIRTRYTVVRALNGREAIVPNEMLITQRVENLSLDDMNVLLSTAVQVAYGTDVRALQAKVVAAVAAVPRVVADPGPACQLADFAADGMNLAISFWIADPANGQGNVRSDVNLAVLDLFAREGVKIPFPQRVMHHIGTTPDAPPAPPPAPQ